MLPLRLRHNFTWVLGGNLLYTACQWGIIVDLAKFGNQQQVGRYTLGLAIAAPVFLLANLQLNAVLATDARREYSFARYFTLRVISTALALTVVAAIVLLGRYSTNAATVIVTIGIMKSFDALSDIFSGLLQQHERMDRVAVAFGVNGAISLFLATLAAVTTHNVVLVAVGSAVGSGLALLTVNAPAGLAIWWRLQRALQGAQPLSIWAFDSTTLLRLMRLAAPLGAVMFLISLGANIPRYVIAANLGDDKVGQYSALVYTLIAGTTVISAMGQAATPRLAAHYSDGRGDKFLSLLRPLLAVSSGLSVVAVFVVVVAGQPLLRLIYRPEYATDPWLFDLLAIASGVSFVASTLGYAMTAARAFKSQVPLFTVTTLATAVGCLLWVPRLGLEGAAWAIILAAVIQLAGSAAILRLALRDRRSEMDRTLMQ